MKATKLLLLAATCAMAHVAAAKDPPKDAKPPVRVEPVFIMGYQPGFLDDHAYLLSNANIVVTSGLPFDGRQGDWSVAMIAPGMNSFTVFYQATTILGPTPVAGPPRSGPAGPATTVKEGSGLMTVAAMFEAGKYYTFDYQKIRRAAFKNDSIVVSIAELEVPEGKVNLAKKMIEDTKEYLAWWQSHPGVLEGTYKTKNGTEWVTFTGDRIHTSTFVFGTKCEYDGRFRYNDETIVVGIDSARVGTKQLKGAGGSFEVAPYKLTDGVLELMSNTGNTFFPKGKYYKGSAVQTSGDTAVTGQQASPGVLEGTYKSSDGKNEMTFTGDKFHISMPGYIFDGTFSFDAQTITLNIESTGEKKKPRSGTEVLHYKLGDGTLDITSKSGGGGIYSMLPPNIKKQYLKSPQ